MMETGKNVVVPKDWDGEEGRLCEKQRGFFFVVVVALFLFVCLLVFRAVKLFCIIL